MIRLSAVLVSVFFFLPVLQAQLINSFTIDDFGVLNGTVADPMLDGNGVWGGFNPGSSVLGNYRVVGNYLVEVTAGDPPGLLYNNATKITSSAFTINNQANTRSAGQVIWQGDGTIPNTNTIVSHPTSFNLGNINFNSLLSSPNFNFQWSVINADDRHWTYTIRAYTNNASNYFEGVIVSDQSEVLLSIAKADFVAIGSPDWADIDALSFSAGYTDGLLGGDLAIDSIQLAVPEVGAHWMVGITAVTVGVYYGLRHRARKKNRSLSYI